MKKYLLIPFILFNIYLMRAQTSTHSSSSYSESSSSTITSVNNDTKATAKSFNLKYESDVQSEHLSDIILILKQNFGEPINDTEKLIIWEANNKDSYFILLNNNTISISYKGEDENTVNKEKIELLIEKLKAYDQAD